jgi:hypothetical protein
MSTHAALSPSKRHRWAACPGSVREEAKYPEPPSGPAAIDGTHTHTLLEWSVENKLANPHEREGYVLKDHEGEFTVDSARAARVKVAVDYIVSRVAEFNGLCEVISETRVDPKWFMGRDDLGGTVDVQIIGGGVLELIDYKDGMNVVEVEGNPQLEQYAIGVLAGCKLGHNVADQYPWHTVRMTIVQPKLALKGMSPISTWEVDVKYLLDRIEVLSREARATDDPQAPLLPGEKQCQYCAAKGGCSALAQKAMSEVSVMFKPQAMDLAQQSADKDPTTMSDQQITQIMEAAPLMRQLLEGVEKEALRRLKAGQPVAGLKLVNGKGSRVWALPESEMAEKLVAMGIPKSAVYETKLVTPAKAEKLTWEKRDGTKMQLSDRQLKTMENEYVVKMAGKLTVVPESDSRPAVVLNAAPMFGAVVGVDLAVPGTDKSVVDGVVQQPESLPSWLT